MNARPVRFALVPLLLCGVAGVALWRALEPSTLLPGIGVGMAAGGVAGWLLARPWRGVFSGLLRIVAALGALAGGVIALTGDTGAVSDAPSNISTFLTVGIPATGLDDLGVAPYSVVALAAAAATWAVLRSHSVLTLLAATVALVASALGAGDAGTPWWVPAMFMVLAAGELMTTSRMAYSELQPLVGTSTAIRRNQHWWRPAFIGLSAGAVGLAALALPGPATFDVRRFVSPDLVDRLDENPLAVAARLRSDPPPTADDVDATIEVIGPSPGRLRLAVLDAYTPEGWHQQATYAVTGNHLVLPDLAGDADEVDDATASTVTVHDEAGGTGLLAVPTAGTPIELTTATGTRYSAAAGLLMFDGTDALEYRTVPDRVDRPSGVVAAPAGTDRALGACADSPQIAELADALTAGIDAPLARLDAIGAWLKVRHIYDVDAPGGQTLGSVERFLSQDFALGNLEVFVTSFALLARCADVPVRVVVGYPAPAGDDTSELVPTDLTAWVETPLAGFGWLAVDPVPTPQEIDAAVVLASSEPDPPPEVAPAAPSTTLPTVAARPLDGGRDWLPVIIGVAAGLVVVATVALVWATRRRHLTISRRARVADPAYAVLLAWTSVMERFVDNGTPLGPHLTASETARATAGRVPVPVTNMLAELAGLVDRARFDAVRSTDDDAGLAWALANEALARLPHGRAVWLGPLRHPRRARARLRLTRRLPRRRARWTGVVPDHTTVLDSRALPTVAGYEIEARIGVGATAAVYRARQLDGGRHVAIKVFAVSVGDRGFDHQRFVWEARVAEMVSGRPHLPEILGSGFTASGQPYLVSKLYRNGTLVRRVRVGGPLSPAAIEAAGRELATALESLHENGVVHGDIKPENVFVDDDDTLVLGDLGASWAKRTATRSGGAGTTMTPAYAAPEVWLGHAATPASDIYSLGLTLMFAATATVPTPGSPPDESEVVAAFGSDLAVALLAVDPRRRLRTASAVADHFGVDRLAAATSSAADSFTLPPPSWTIRTK